ncbi:MAG: hypothetical protein JWQ66_1104 [Mucilaginibacter sp.]|nr:hypothetical protein [Mucilaginibacter sp.]
MYINKMKRTFTILTIALVTLMAFRAKAQDDDKHVKSYVGFFGGLSNPIGDFASTNYDNNKSGFAKRGVTFGLDGAYYFYKNLGIGATFSFHDQGELTQTDGNNLAAGYTSAYHADNSIVTGVDRYHYLSALIGPQYSFTYGKFIFDLRASAGILKVSSTPSTQIQVVGVPEQTAIFTQKSASATVLGYSGDIGIRYKLSQGVHLVLRGNYINSSGPSITTINRTDNLGRLVTKQPITAIQTTLGLIFSF